LTATSVYAGVGWSLHLQNAMWFLRTSKLSTNDAAFNYKVPRTLRAYLA